jgi:hypothetical protein
LVDGRITDLANRLCCTHDDSLIDEVVSGRSDSVLDDLDF